MLTADQIRRSDSGFCLYDHDWRFFSEFLGEPFVLDNYLAYFDGSWLYFCAFPLDDCRPEASLDALVGLIRRTFPHQAAVRGLNIWGRFNGEGLQSNPGTPLRLLEVSEYSTTDATLDLRSFSYQTVASARLAKNSAVNKGIVAEVCKADRLSWEHIGIIERFLSAHDVSTTHASFYLSTPSVIKLPHVHLVEGRRNGELHGFGIVSLPNERAASILMAFYDNHRGSRASDGVVAKTIDWAQSQNCERLHFGYSGSSSLFAFKRKWGPLTLGPTYREAFFVADDSIVALVRRGTFPWRERLFLAVVNKTVAGVSQP